MIQPNPRFSPNSSARNRRNLLGGGFGLLSATLLLSWGCSDGATPPPQGTGGTPTATGGTAATTGGTPAATGGTPAATGGTPAATGGTPAATGGTPAATGGTPAGTGGTPAGTGGTPAGTGGTPAGTGGTAAIPACVTTVFTQKCTICHSPSGAPVFGGLDLTGDFLPRLLDKPATNIGVTNMASCVSGAKLIDSAAPDSSVLLKRLIGPPDCGTMMPSGTTLSSEEQACFRSWVQTF
jgi:hypothetical protein